MVFRGLPRAGVFFCGGVGDYVSGVVLDDLVDVAAWETSRVCVYYCRTYYKAVRGGGRRRVEDMRYERRRAEACVDESLVTWCVKALFASCPVSLRLYASIYSEH